jgi:hypothetical protein
VPRAHAEVALFARDHHVVDLLAQEQAFGRDDLEGQVLGQLAVGHL